MTEDVLAKFNAEKGKVADHYNGEFKDASQATTIMPADRINKLNGFRVVLDVMRRMAQSNSDDVLKAVGSKFSTGTDQEKIEIGKQKVSEALGNIPELAAAAKYDVQSVITTRGKEKVLIERSEEQRQNALALLQGKSGNAAGVVTPGAGPVSGISQAGAPASSVMNVTEKEHAALCKSELDKKFEAIKSSSQESSMTTAIDKLQPIINAKLSGLEAETDVSKRQATLSAIGKIVTALDKGDAHALGSIDLGDKDSNEALSLFKDEFIAYTAIEAHGPRQGFRRQEQVDTQIEEYDSTIAEAQKAIRDSLKRLNEKAPLAPGSTTRRLFTPSQLNFGNSLKDLQATIKSMSYSSDPEKAGKQKKSIHSSSKSKVSEFLRGLKDLEKLEEREDNRAYRAEKRERELVKDDLSIETKRLDLVRKASDLQNHLVEQSLKLEVTIEKTETNISRENYKQAQYADKMDKLNLRSQYNPGLVESEVAEKLALHRRRIASANLSSANLYNRAIGNAATGLLGRNRRLSFKGLDPEIRGIAELGVNTTVNIFRYNQGQAQLNRNLGNVGRMTRDDMPQPRYRPRSQPQAEPQEQGQEPFPEE